MRFDDGIWLRVLKGHRSGLGLRRRRVSVGLRLKQKGALGFRVPRLLVCSEVRLIPEARLNIELLRITAWSRAVNKFAVEELRIA